MSIIVQSKSIISKIFFFFLNSGVRKVVRKVNKCKISCFFTFFRWKMQLCTATAGKNIYVWNLDNSCVAVESGNASLSGASLYNKTMPNNYISPGTFNHTTFKLVSILCFFPVVFLWLAISKKKNGQIISYHCHVQTRSAKT